MRQLAVFTKHWQAGHAKTRLAAAIGASAASRVALEFIKLAVQRFAGMAERRALVFTPREQQMAFESVAGPAWQCVPQMHGDLGERLHTYFDGAFAAGAEQVVVIGSDSPTLPTDYLQRAYELLQQYEVVLGPTEDGGYYLVGAARTTPDIFSGIRWSTPDVWPGTLARLASLGIAYATLPAWYDVDHGADLDRLRAELGAATSGADMFQSLRRLLDEIVNNSSPARP